MLRKFCVCVYVSRAIFNHAWAACLACLALVYSINHEPYATQKQAGSRLGLDAALSVLSDSRLC